MSACFARYMNPAFGDFVLVAVASSCTVRNPHRAAWIDCVPMPVRRLDYRPACGITAPCNSADYMPALAVSPETLPGYAKIVAARTVLTTYTDASEALRQYHLIPGRRTHILCGQ